MTTNRRRRTRKARALGELIEDQIDFFKYGLALDNPSHPYMAIHGNMSFPFKDEAHKAALWVKYKDQIIELYMAEARRKRWPGIRHSSFWETAPPRLPKPPEKDENLKVFNWQTKRFEWCESDIEFLRRLNLLEPWEEKLIQNERKKNEVTNR